MITRTPTLIHASSWQNQLKDLISSHDELFSILNLDPADFHIHPQAIQKFPLRVPRSFVAKMQIGNPNDPLLLQVLPKREEINTFPGFSDDPLEETNSNPIPGIIHKYHGRVLFIVSSNCAVHCRYCFRRHFPYEDNNPSLSQWKDSLQYIEKNDSINEIILSGGDPLAVNDRYITQLIDWVADIPHIKRIRIHSRLAAMIPERLTPDLINALTRHDNIKPILVFHFNHPQELNDDKFKVIFHQLSSKGVTLLNQTVLLKGVNDNAQTLSELSERLFDVGILPYYLHLLDSVNGAHHFDVDHKKIPALYDELLSNLPGFLVPKIVKEIPGEKSKTLMYRGKISHPALQPQKTSQ